MKRLIGCSGMLAFFLLAAPSFADTRFQVRRMTRGDVPLGRGQCDIRLQVDNEAEVTVRGDMVFVRTLAGRDPWDDGSECNAPLPDHEVSGFRFEVKDGRGQIRLLEEPSRRNGYGAAVAIRDPEGGVGRYHFRLSWDMRAADFRGEEPERRPGPPGFAWNNVLHFRGEGRGAASMPDGFEMRLGDASVDIDRGGRVVAVFRGERGRELVFNGNVTGREGGRWRADVVSEDRRFRGPMFLSTGDRDDINSITIEAGDGRNRMRLNWDRR
ncbi:MAG TPA: hypothetical protein VKX45_12460 [Bryobacteraceae bacterium]|nr:hypothetical protein [Bryobacteraceae bacterium]